MAKETIEKNPLSVCLGIVFRKARERKGWSYEHLSKITNIKATYLQSFETANAIFHVSKALSLYQAFSSEEGNEFSLEALTIMLSLISTIETIGNEKVDDYIKQQKNKGTETTIAGKNKAYKEGAFTAVKILADSNLKFKTLFQKFFLWELFGENARSTHRFNYEHDVWMEVQLFLTNYDNYGLPLIERNTNYVFEHILDVPTFYLEFLKNMQSSVLKLPQKISINEIADWEKSNYTRIENALVIMNGSVLSRPKQPPVKANFKPSILWSASLFPNVLLFANTVEPELIYPAENNINFKFTPGYNLEKEVRDLLILDNKAYDIVWVYFLKDSLSIAFAADIYYVQNCIEFKNSEARILLVSELLAKLPFINKHMGRAITEPFSEEPPRLKSKD